MYYKNKERENLNETQKWNHHYRIYHFENKQTTIGKLKQILTCSSICTLWNTGILKIRWKWK